MITLFNLIKLLLSSHLLLIEISVSSAQDDGRIVGGVPTSIEVAPYLVQIRENDFILCSGTLVSEYFVITAAHCFGKTPKNLSVVGGATKIYKDPGTARSAVSGYMYPKDYDNETFHMDIAVIKLKQPLKGALIQHIPMTCDDWKDGDKVKIFGWGKQGDHEKNIPLQLQSVEVKAISQGWCKWLYHNRKNITDVMFCAAMDGKDACNGDSGGPAIVNNQLCGVISWGVGCAQKNSPGVYTNLKKVSAFVKRAMKKLKKIK